MEEFTRTMRRLTPSSAEVTDTVLRGGSCSRGSACDQTCYDLHDGTYECGCRPGFVLNDNGYKCDGSCSRGSACDQTCYDLHDGTYECGCRPGFVLNDNGYKCDAVLEPRALPVSSVGSPAAPADSPAPQSGAAGRQEADKAANSSAAPACDLACVSGQCVREVGGREEVELRCACPLGLGGDLCQSALEVHSPRFSGASFAQLPPPVEAHTDMRLTLEFRPEDWDGLLLMSGETADLAGDFMAVVLTDGFVEFRFDCGSGLGVVRSREPVLLDRWNRLTLIRTRSYVWMQLNNGQHTEGMSQGIFWHITFELPLYVGGARGVAGLQPRLGVVGGYRGCIRLLQINERSVDFRPAPAGHVGHGWDIGECGGDLCSRTPCGHGGRCVSAPDGSTTCLCPLGYLGELCEKSVDLQVPSFNGSSHLKFPGLGTSALSYLALELTIKPTGSDGIVLYNGLHDDGQGEFMAVSMRDGHVEFAFDLGAGVTFVRTTRPVTLHTWHEVHVSRTGREAVLKVDDQPAVVGRSHGGFTQLTLPQNLFLGGVANYNAVSSALFLKDGFQGCVQKLVINDKPVHVLAAALSGYNVANCAHPCVTRPCGAAGTCEPRGQSYRCQCRLGNSGPRCRRPLPAPHVPRFAGHSHLVFDRPDVAEKLRGVTNGIELEFRTRYPNGLLVWTGASDRWTADFLAVGLRDGHVHLRFDLGSGMVTVEHNASRVDDGQWHRVQASRVGRDGVISVDGGYPVSGVSPGLLSQLDTDGRLLIGGTSELEYVTHGLYSTGLDGCVAEVIIAPDHIMDLTSSDDGRNIGFCL
ncbi:pikachurin-like [Pollicipes pollicipes]|uniref:pikachurin-like n=1 Tax=Pollicipes pollicipes TaxID=41117 RepID=UPI0018856ADE|nr:pikachurin-like [Pollicipes pollicipes]